MPKFVVKNSLVKEYRSFRAAWQGIVQQLRHETHLQFHVVAAIIVLFAAWYWQLNTQEWIAIVLCITMVIAAELMNSAIEHLTDLVSPDYHLLAKHTKDAAAGAVLVLAIGAAVVGVLIFLPKIAFTF